MQNTSLPSALNDEIEALENELYNALKNDLAIESSKIKLLHTLRMKRVNELIRAQQKQVANREQRFDEMKKHTRHYASMTQFTDTQMNLNPELVERIHAEAERYDLAAARWVNEELTDWAESEASSIMAGILILVAEVRHES